jgi:tRNA U54 and U55 pseudouridine synthase Pus10
MLGSGRPFVIEIEDPKRRNPIDLEAYMNMLNAEKKCVKVLGLHYTDIGCFSILK